MRSGFIALLLFAAPLTGSHSGAQALTMADLEGHSVILDFEEIVTTGRGEPFQQRWQNRVYFSTKGRIFDQFNRSSPRSGQSRSWEAVGDEEGFGEGRAPKFVWNGQGVTRQWANRRGHTRRQTITITPSGNGYSCYMTLERSGGRGFSHVVDQSCRVVRGNAVADNQ